VKAITIRQPWAHLIAAGVKDVENRSRNWSHRGRIAVHAGQTDDRAAVGDGRVRGSLGLSWPAMPHGRVLAVVTLADCHRAEAGCCNSQWANPAPGFHLVLTDVVRLPRPIPAVGQLGLWQLPTAVLVELGRQLREIEVSE
jgi:hypothetical protein